MTLPDGVRCFPFYHQLLEEPLDILFVSLPNYLSAKVTIAGLDKNLHVFCEKPPGRDLEDIKKVIETEKSHLVLFLKYGFNHRYHDSVSQSFGDYSIQKLGEIVNLRGIYGKSKIIPFPGGWRAERKYAGGRILLDQGIHMVDLMRLFCGEFEEVQSFVSNKFWKHDVEDNVYAIVRDKKGRIAMLHSSATQWQHRFVLDITLTEGGIELHGILTGSKSYGEETLIVRQKAEVDEGNLRFEKIKYLEDNSWKNEIDEFAESITNGNKITNGNSKEALATMKLVYQIYYADPLWRDAYQILSLINRKAIF